MFTKGFTKTALIDGENIKTLGSIARKHPVKSLVGAAAGGAMTTAYLSNPEKRKKRVLNLI